MADAGGLPADVERRRLALPEAGVEIALLDWGGEGPLALLHHANGFCAALWAPIAEALRDRFHVVAMDARGHGDSSLPSERPPEEAFAWPVMAADLRAVALTLLQETGHSQIALGLGHSFGGTLTLAAESAHPGLYQRIVMVDPVLRSPEDIGALAGSTAGDLLAERARVRRHVFPSRAEARAHFAARELFKSWTDRALDLYVEEGLLERPDGQLALKCPGAVEAAIFEGSGFQGVWEGASAARAPALFLWAKRGNFSRATYEQLAERMPGGVVETLDAGHLVSMEQPQIVVDAVRRFCA
ncbi:MAG: alpha/beta fold hydrolase [Deltaproteobacteria bacterium]|nr:alpha/beta fold hydrolase [Deltaproteobacteria bacterium]